MGFIGHIDGFFSILNGRKKLLGIFYQLAVGESEIVECRQKIKLWSESAIHRFLRSYQ